MNIHAAKMKFKIKNGFAESIWTACCWFVGVFNVISMVIGTGLLIKGLHYRSMDVDFWTSVLGLDEYLRQISMLTYILPGLLIIFFGCIGVCGFNCDGEFLIPLLVCYSIWLIGLITRNTYGLFYLGSDEFSVYANYINRLMADDGKFGLVNGVVYMEYAMQIALLISSVYIIWFTYVARKEEEEEKEEYKRVYNERTSSKIAETGLYPQLSSTHSYKPDKGFPV